MELLTDAELWRRSQARDPIAFGLLFDRYASAIYGYCFRRTGDWAVAEDLTSVVFLEAWRRCPHVELTARRALPWLLGVATNVIRNQRRSVQRYRRALQRIPPLEPERDFADELADRVDAQRRMRAVLVKIAQLPRPEREVLALCVWEGLSAVEAAQALDIPEATVRTRLHRLRRRLRTAVALDESATVIASKGVNSP